MNWVKMATLTVIGLAMAGCVSFFGLSKHDGNSPEYCYDCHYQPRWDKAYDECDYYVFQVKEAGYYYRSRNDNRTEFKFRPYEAAKARERQKADYDYRQEQKNKK
jgi:hypothetical protein